MEKPTISTVILSDPVELLPDTEASRELLRLRAAEVEKALTAERERIAEIEKVYCRRDLFEYLIGRSPAAHARTLLTAAR